MSRLLIAALTTWMVAAAIPEYLSPVSYNLLFRLDLDNPKDGFVGNEVLEFRTTKNLTRGITSIVLNSLGLKITSAILRYPSSKQFTIKNIDYDESEGTVTMAVDQELEPNNLYKLSIEYNGDLNETQGLFISKYNNENYLGMNSYPVYAKQIYPCFDKPNLRAKYNIKLEIYYSRKTDPIIISGLNGTFSPVKRDMSWGKYKTKYLSGAYSSDIDLPPYGFIFAVGNYAQKESLYYPNDKTYINIINPDLMDVLSSNVIQDLAKNAGFNMKLVVVPGLNVPSVSGYGIAAMSNDISTLMSDYSTLTVKDQAIEMLKGAVKTFFTAVVSPSSWNDVWLAESIPLYIAHSALNQMTTSWKYWPKIEVLALQEKALSNSWSTSSSPVIPKNLNSTSDVLKFISDPAITKGAAILGMLETLALTPLKSFVGFINLYKGEAVSSNDFLKFYEKFNNMNHTLPDGKSLQSVTNSWLTLTGYPYLSVSRNDHEVYVNKKRFGQNDHGQSTWMLPLSFKTFYLNSTNVSTIALTDPNIVWLDDKENGNYSVVKDPLHNLLVIFNVHGPGPYRVRYDDSSLQYLTKKLQNDVNFLKNEFLRSTLVNDNFAFAQQGLIKYTSLFDTLRYMKSERSLGPWTVASKGFRNLWALLYFSDLRLQFQNYVTDLMRPTYLEYGIDPESSDFENGMLRKEIIGGMCDYGDEACLYEAKRAYQTYIVGEKSIADADIIDLLYCNGFRNVMDGTKIRQELQQKYQPSLPQYKKTSLFYYLSCSGEDYSESDAISSLLEDVLVSPSYNEMPMDDMVLAFKEIANKPQHYQEALEYFIDQYDSIRTKLENEKRAELIRHLGTLGSTEEHLHIFGNFSYQNSSDHTIVSAVQDAIKSIQSRKKFLELNYNDLYQGLYGYVPTTNTPSAPPNTSENTPTGTADKTTSTSTIKPTPSSSIISKIAIPSLLAYCMLMIKYLA